MEKKYRVFAVILLLLCLLVSGFYIGNSRQIESARLFLKGYNFDGILLSLLILIATLILEFFILPWKDTSVHKFLHPNKSVITDIVIGSIYLLGLASIFKGLVFIGLGLDVTLTEESGASDPAKNTVWFLIYFVLADFLKYWYHRICHEVEFLWQIHKFHHAATEFVVITGNRIHPVERILQNILVFAPLALLGLTVETYLGILILASFIDKLQHSSIDWNAGWFGKYVFFSPVGHRIHHSEEEEHWDKNYGDFFVIWDKMFGTYYNNKKINKEVGVSDNWMNEKGMIYDLMHSTYLSLVEFKKSLISRQWKATHMRKELEDNYTKN